MDSSAGLPFELAITLGYGGRVRPDAFDSSQGAADAAQSPFASLLQPDLPPGGQRLPVTGKPLPAAPQAPTPAADAQKLAMRAEAGAASLVASAVALALDAGAEGASASRGSGRGASNSVYASSVQGGAAAVEAELGGGAAVAKSAASIAAEEGGASAPNAAADPLLDPAREASWHAARDSRAPLAAAMSSAGVLARAGSRATASRAAAGIDASVTSAGARGTGAPGANGAGGALSDAAAATEGFRSADGSRAAMSGLDRSTDVGSIDLGSTDAGSLDGASREPDLAAWARSHAGAATARGAADAAAQTLVDAAPADGADAFTIGIAPSAARPAGAHASSGMPHVAMTPDGSAETAAAWSRPLAGRVQWMVDQGIGEARIKLNPPELGSIDVRISIVDDKTFVQLTASQAHARDALEQSLPRLRELLAFGGLDVGGASVDGGGRGGDARASEYRRPDSAELGLSPGAPDVPAGKTAGTASGSEHRIDLFA